MRIVHLNTFDQCGGAAITVSRLHRALLASGVDSRLLVQFQAAAATGVMGPRGKWDKGLALAADTLDAVPLMTYRDRTEAVFSCSWMPSPAAGRALLQKPDVVHLHWVNGGMLTPRALRRFPMPIVWTLHDMWPFTGGCHQAGDCVGYLSQCGACPALGSTRAGDLSRRLLAGKCKAWHDLPIIPVAPSEWLAERARQSRVFAGRDIEVIPHGVDRSLYRPWDQAMAREIFGLPTGKLVMFSAAKGLHSPQKGVAAVHRIMEKVRQELPEACLVVMGSDAPSGASNEAGIHYLGHLHDDVSRALAFSAVDSMLMPSEGESFGNVVLESLACGTPVASYATGAAPNLLRDGRGGETVAVGDEQGLIDILLKLLSATSADRESTRACTEGYDLSDMAEAYRVLYQRVCGVA